MNKKGFVNVFITLGVALILIIIIISFFIYFQINLVQTKIKNDLNFAIYDGIVAINRNEFGLGSYSIDKIVFENIITNWCENVKKDIPWVIEAKIMDITIFNGANEINLSVKLSIKFTPVIKIKEHATTIIVSDINLSRLKYERMK